MENTYGADFLRNSTCFWHDSSCSEDGRAGADGGGGGGQGDEARVGGTGGKDFSNVGSLLNLLHKLTTELFF